MKQIIVTAMMLLALGSANEAKAHEGHDKTPGALPLDGFDQIQATDHLYLKLRMEKGGVKIYPFSHENKPVALSGMKLEGTTTSPKKSKPETVAFTPEGDAFTAKVDAKGAHRYTLDVVVTHDGKKEKTKFNVEPQ